MTLNKQVLPADMVERLIDPDMAADEIRLHMGEMTAQEMRTARAAIGWANSRATSLEAENARLREKLGEIAAHEPSLNHNNNLNDMIATASVKTARTALNPKGVSDNG